MALQVFAGVDKLLHFCNDELCTVLAKVNLIGDFQYFPNLKRGCLDDLGIIL